MARSVTTDSFWEHALFGFAVGGLVYDYHVVSRILQSRFRSAAFEREFEFVHPVEHVSAAEPNLASYRLC